jgi:WD40 repeat protein
MPGDVTHLLNAIDSGDPKAAEELLPLVYEELRRLAAHKMANERPGQTLQATALVHEAWLRVAGSDRQQWRGRERFFSAAAEAMRRILVDKARRKLSVRDAAYATAAADDPIGALTAHTNRIWSLAFAPDGRLISCAEDSKGFVWDLTKKQPAQKFESLFDVGVGANGLYLVTAIGYGRIRILTNAFSLKKPLFEIGSSSSNDVVCAALSPDGTQLVAGGEIGSTGRQTFLTALEWQVNGKPHVVGTHETGITDVQFSADGRYLASADNGGTVKLWDARRLSEPQEGRVLLPRSAARASHPNPQKRDPANWLIGLTGSIASLGFAW